MTDATTVPASGGLMDDLLEIFTAPARVFERRRAAGYGKHMIVLMLLTLVILAATLSLSGPYFDAQYMLGMRQAAERGAALPPEATGSTAMAIARWGTVAVFVVMIPIMVWIGALFVMLGAKVAGTSIGYKQGALISTLAGFPRLLSPVATAIQGLFADPASIRSMSDAALGPSRLVDPMTTPPVLLGILGNFDLTNLWAIVLVGIGVSVIGRVSRGSGMVAAAVVFACTLALTIIPAALA